MKIIVTGGAGFIGSALVRFLISQTDAEVLNIDALTYAGNLENLARVADHPRYHFEQANICDHKALQSIFAQFDPDGVIHLAAESHVDRSIDGPADFINTNIVGTYNLLESARFHWTALAPARRDSFRFHHVSTDEVYGSLGETGLFHETTAYDPSSPYSASKASSDHLVRAWHRTFGLPVVLTNCSNNYGPYQFPEKLIPLMIQNSLMGKRLPIYGTGENIRDWLFVEDHVEAIYTVFRSGRVGQTYNIGGNCEKTNREVVEAICSIMDEVHNEAQHLPHSSLITFVQDRPGHDRRYAIDCSKLANELGWRPRHTFESGLRTTIQWYVDNQQWCENIRTKTYNGERLGKQRATC